MDAQELSGLLELAAKASGKTLRFNSLGGVDARYPWAPHEDSGDALQLACDLSIDILHRFVGGSESRQ